MKLLDTCFLIDLQKEWIGGQPGPATDYLSARSQEEFAISVVTVLEFLEGYEQASDGERFLSPFRQLEVAGPAARIGARLRRRLRQQGELIGDFDILIAATALHADVTLVTGNSRHFGRIPDLKVESYV
jgi:tRNA(fMet)-specific endonuclease VapC